ncbi:LppA family lipoprotein [Saccharomonospora marina]|uniref:LppA family lipoprotein n=1 Tax=Saccharomonospora marina TaxID=632569 RepID=UPI0005927228|nr:LppA family lipoprotein [Saccharomonospora marina]
MKGSRVFKAGLWRVVVAAALAVLLLPAACGTEGGDINDDPNAGTVQEQFDTLLQRPSFERMTERYKEMVTEVRQRRIIERVHETDIRAPHITEAARRGQLPEADQQVGAGQPTLADGHG